MGAALPERTPVPAATMIAAVFPEVMGVRLAQPTRPRQPTPCAHPASLAATPPFGYALPDFKANPIP
ncbi:hypothetical protein GCM10011395_18730 [Sphingomonas psychrolutea]|uniref:Uncharacterized protein n=1 Tax=Sphingomonas psychrolutea TaxID=1259676 RepID=A0ABQ1GRG7_9SPHN|nr:hypothetical protein GCM10011395_18730 [Sphingomonas psychrolutea]